MDNESRDDLVSEDIANDPSSSGSTDEEVNDSGEGNSSGSYSGPRTYNGREGIVNDAARGMDRLSYGANNLSNRLKNSGDKLNNYANKHQDSKLGKTAGSMGDRLNKAGNKVGNLGNKLNNVNRGVQTANNINNAVHDPSAAKEMAVQKAKQVAKDTAKKAAKEVNKKVVKTTGKTLAKFLLTNPYFWLILGIVVGAFVLFLVIYSAFLTINFSDGSVSSNTCVSLSSVDNVCKSITVKGIGTMDLDDYVAGVVKAEVGGLANDEMYKAGAVTARSYVLANADRDSNGNCIVGSSEGFQVYDSNPNESMINAAKETTGIVMTKDGNVYSTQYDAFCMESKDSNNYYICQGNNSTTAIPVSWINENVPKSYHNRTKGNHAHGNGMSQYGAYYLITEKGWDYIEVLEYFYGDSGAVLASASGSTSSCGSSLNNVGNFQPFTYYNLNRAGLSALDSKLTTSQVQQLNSYINSEVDKAGYGTGGGVAAAAQSLVYGLEQMGYYLRYEYGARNISLGVDPDWVGYNTMDCSAFVSWAIKNGCNSSFGSVTSLGFNDKKYGPQIDIKDAKPGDIMVTHGKGHIRLVVKNNGDGSVITAEETSGKIKGLAFTNRTSDSKYHFTDMSGYYSSYCNNER